MKFAEIEKNLNVRSNKLAYYLKEMLSKNVLVKENDFYMLSNASEYLIPYLSEKKSVLPVILIRMGNIKECFLYERNKRPFSNKLSLPVGRLLMGESISQATSRIMKKFDINAKFKKINSISLEHVKKNTRIVHSFLLIFVDASSKDKIKLVNILKNKKKIISSDLKLIQEKENKMNIPTIFTNTH